MTPLNYEAYLESRRAEALSGVADGVGSALGLSAEVLPVELSRNRGARGAPLKRVSDEPEPALAIVSPEGVDTLCIWAADGVQAFVDVVALGVGDALEALPAHALRATRRHGTAGGRKDIEIKVT